MPHTIEIIGDLMCVLDEDGNGCDGAVLESYRAAKRQVQKWTADYTFDVAEAYGRLCEHFSRR